MLPIFILLIVSFFWKKARLILLIFAIIISSLETFYVLYRQDALLHEWYMNEAAVINYLKDTYPDDQWVSRRAIRSGKNSTDVEIIFIDEPEATYFYEITGGRVNLAGYSLEDGYETPKRK